MKVQIFKWMRLSFVTSIGAFIVAAITVVGALLGISQYFENKVGHNLNGQWEMSFFIESTSYKPYQGMQIGYKVFLAQNETAVSIKGEKLWVDGQIIPIDERVSIELSGAMAKDELPLTFTLSGEARTTFGFVDLTVESDDRISGSFTSTGADSSGRVTMRKGT